MPSTTSIDRDSAIAWYRKNRARTAALFDLLSEDAYYSQPISLRHPIVFYEGHLPAFSLNTLVKKGLGQDGIDERLETLFARGIDPDTEPTGGNAPQTWPSREEVRSFANAADALVIDALENGDIERHDHPLLRRAQAVFTILEHEVMHQETLLYMWHQLPHHQKRAPADYRAITTASAIQADEVYVPPGTAAIGTDPEEVTFGWDNEFGPLHVDVAGFCIDRLNVTNGDYLAFVDAGGYTREELWTPENWRWVVEHQIKHPLFWTLTDGAWHWRGMFELIPLPLTWPVYVSHAEASAYAKWRESRLPSEAEFHRAAYATAVAGESRRFPWGDAAADDSRGVFDFSSWEPQPVGTHTAGRSAWGVEDLVGNGWEWTSTSFGPLPGFVPHASYPEYSADFFDEAHFVIKGASPATARELLRPTFRNWFRPRYPYVYATFRCARDAKS